MDYIERMIEEKIKLEIKINKLRKFQEKDTYKVLSEVQQCYIEMQLVHMESYRKILGDRIKTENLMISDDKFRDAIYNRKIYK